jgi:hypothetical protein
MKVLDNVLDKGRDALHHVHHNDKPDNLPEHEHKRNDTASTVFSHRSDTVKSTSNTSQRPPRPYLTRVPTVQTK